MPHPILFNDQPLFAGSPGRADADAEVRVGADALRVIEQAGPGDRGVRVVGRGREARPIVQAGWLVADTQGELDARLEAIRAYLDGREYPLVDGWGRRHERVVMVRFVAADLERVGPRVGVRYSVEYVQTIP